MLTVLLSTATAGLFGVADFLGGLASRRESAISVTAASHGTGMLIFAVAIFLFPAPMDRTSLTAGFFAGISGGVGVSALYAGLARGRMSVVAPITAAISGSLPAAFDFANGSRIAPTSLAGLVLAVVATLVVSASSMSDDGEEQPMPFSAVLLAVLAGLGFAGSFISFSLAAETSGFWPLITARLTSFSLLVFVTAVRGRLITIAPEVRKITLSAGLIDTVANVTMVSAIRLGPLAVASVLGSLYPVVTVLLARAVLKERIRGLQRVGVGVAFAAVGLAALPWPLRLPW